jgi:hypothetical protein
MARLRSWWLNVEIGPWGAKSGNVFRPWKWRVRRPRR